MTTTPNMSLELPTNGADIGTWGTKLNVALPIVDSHNHTTGKGVKVPTAGLNIDADLSFGNFAASAVGKIGLTPITALAAGSTTVFVSAADNELYWRTAGGTNVKLTNGNALNVGAFVGGIIGDYTSTNAQLAYDDATGAYTFKRGGTHPWARLRAADLRLYEYNTLESVYTAIKASAAIAASYDITLPAAAAASQVLLQIDAAGQVSFSNTLVANADITLVGTGEYNHGDKKICVSPLVAHTISGAGHSFGSSSNAVFCQVSTTGVVHFPINGVREGARLKSVSFYGVGATSPGITVWLQVQDSCAQLPSVQSGSWIGGGNLVATLNTPNTITGENDTVYVRVASGGSTVNVFSIFAIYDVP